MPDIRGLMSQLEAKGIKATVPVTDFRPGVTIAMVADPDGNTVEFLQNTPSWQVTLIGATLIVAFQDRNERIREPESRAGGGASA